MPGVFFNKDASLRPTTLLKKRLWHRSFPGNFVKFLRTPVSIEYHWWLLLDTGKMFLVVIILSDILFPDSVCWVFKQTSRISYLEVFLGKALLKICSKFTGEHPCQSVISIKLQAALLKPHFGMDVLL